MYIMGMNLGMFKGSTNFYNKLWPVSSTLDLGKKLRQIG